MKPNEITVQQAFNNFKPKLGNPKMCTGRKRTMKIQPNICFFKLFFDKSGYQQQMIIMNKNLLGHLSELILDLNNLMSKFLIQSYVTRPVLDTFILHIIKILKVMKQWPYIILIKQQKWQGFFSRHEDRISTFFFELGIQVHLLSLSHVFKGSHQANPFEIYFLPLDHLFQCAVHNSRIMETILDF